ncbi:MAG: hypothetical protein IJ568_00050 [Bacilli bacterium]|nr:hypothetical protein [Bacilli bacterium]
MEFNEMPDVLGETCAYFNVQNLLVDHSLTPIEIEEYKNLIFSLNNLQQVYFKDDCDIKTMETIKNLLTISEYIDDSNIEKYVLFNLSNEEKENFLNSNFENPDTWQIPYEKESDNYTLTDIPRFRVLKNYVKKLIDNNLSSVEEIMKVYDSVKMMDYKTAEEIIQLPLIVQENSADSYGMNKLFSYVLTEMGYKTFIGKTNQDGDASYVTLVLVDDSKYNIHGIYLFDPSMDTLSKEEYKKEDIRRINYNFFMIPLGFMEKLTFNDKLSGILSFLSIDDYNYSKEKIDNCKIPRLLKEKDKLLISFDKDYEDIYNIIKKSKKVDIDKIININDVLYKNKSENYNKMLKDNYSLRKDELFVKDRDEELEELIEEEKKLQM